MTSDPGRGDRRPDRATGRGDPAVRRRLAQIAGPPPAAGPAAAAAGAALAVHASSGASPALSASPDAPLTSGDEAWEADPVGDRAWELSVVTPVRGIALPGPSVPVVPPVPSVPDAEQPRAPARTSAALDAAAAGYAAAHGSAADRAPARRRRRVRLALSWRATAALGVALALVVGAVVLRAADRPTAPAAVLPVPVPGGTPVPGVAEGATRAGSDASVTASTPPTTLVVHVVGAVARPGVQHLLTGARVVDALEAAGGATADADLALVNLARPIVDGEQVLVPRVGEAPPVVAGAGGGPDDGLVDLNTADAAALAELPGIGEVLAGRIIDFRAEHPFASVDELGDVSGIGPKLFEQLRPLVRV